MSNSCSQCQLSIFPQVVFYQRPHLFLDKENWNYWKPEISSYVFCLLLEQTEVDWSYLGPSGRFLPYYPINISR